MCKLQESKKGLCLEKVLVIQLLTKSVEDPWNKNRLCLFPIIKFLHVIEINTC